jgi:hypothetical protein
MSVVQRRGRTSSLLPRQLRAQLEVEIAKQKPVWEKSLSARKEMRAKKNRAVVEQSAKLL